MTDGRARQGLPGAGDRTFAAERTAPWHAEALRIANQLRAPHVNATKVEIAKAIVEHVPGAPTSTETLSRWLGEKEDTGELASRLRP